MKHVKHPEADAIVDLDVAGLGALLARTSGDTGFCQGYDTWASRTWASRTWASRTWASRASRASRQPGKEVRS